jgi:hypothetical protein
MMLAEIAKFSSLLRLVLPYASSLNLTQEQMARDRWTQPNAGRKVVVPFGAID